MGFVTNDVKRRWPGNCIPYTFHRALDSTEESITTQAMEHWESNADVRFVRRNEQHHYVLFVPDMNPLDGAYSSNTVGMLNDPTQIRVDPNPSVGIMIHEIGHALGFFHEQQRTDRDRFVRINEGNILDGFHHNFEIHDDGMRIGTYDLKSIMHYNAYTFNKNGRRTIVPHNLALKDTLGGDGELSPTDIEATAYMNRGNLHVYELDGNGELTFTIQQQARGNSVSTRTAYGARVFTFPARMIFFNRNTGSGILTHVEGDGAIGDTLARLRFSTGWSHFFSYQIGNGSYLFQYNRTSGLIRVRGILPGGDRLGDVFQTGSTFRGGWDVISPYESDNGHAMLFYKKDTGDLSIHRMNDDGTIGQRIQDGTWDAEWSHIEPFRTPRGTFIMRYRKTDGQTEVLATGPSGLAREVVRRPDLASGWDTILPYRVGDRTFLLLYENTKGLLSIRAVGEGGTIGQQTDRRLFNSEWRVATVYGDGNPRLMMVKP